jgi:membrane associated rhomboid family serine protease
VPALFTYTVVILVAGFAWLAGGEHALIGASGECFGKLSLACDRRPQTHTWTEDDLVVWDHIRSL